MKSALKDKNKVSVITLLNMLALLGLGGCTVFQPAKTISMSTYSIEVQHDAAGATTSGEQTMLVSTPNARPGYDSRRMVYTKRPNELEFFTQNQWVDSPARMLAPLIMQALENSAKYRSVVTTRSAVSADLRLDTEVVKLQQEFATRPSQVHLTVRAQLIDLQGQKIVATREFNVVEAATSDDPYGGVLATNKAVKILLLQIVDFCAAESKVDKLK